MRTDLRSGIFFICYHGAFEVDFDAGCGGTFRVASDGPWLARFVMVILIEYFPIIKAASFPMEVDPRLRCNIETRSWISGHSLGSFSYFHFLPSLFEACRWRWLPETWFLSFQSGLLFCFLSFACSLIRLSYQTGIILFLLLLFYVKRVRDPRADAL